MRQNIRSRMAYHGVTSKELAAYLQMTPSSFSDKLNGKKSWWLEEAVNITNYFRIRGDDVDVMELFEAYLHQEAVV